LELACQFVVQTVSEVHKYKLDEIRREHAEVEALLTFAAQKGQDVSAGAMMKVTGFPAYNAAKIQTAAANANDAYALLMIATAEGFMRAYLDSVGIDYGPEPKLNTLIDRCRREFNLSNPRIKIRIIDADRVHDLRRQRNSYSHGYGTQVFPTVSSVFMTLGRFFANMP
jgi:hypothetical protein